MVRDVGERKRAEEKLRLAEERLKLALEGADLGTWDWNMKTGEVVINERWAEMRGYRLEEVRPDAHFVAAGIHPDDRPRVRAALDDYLAARVPAFVAEFRARTRANEWIWLLDRGKVFARDEHGRPTRMAGTALDITARKQAEERLRIAEARSSGILSISADAIISVDADQRITTFNTGAETIFGYDGTEIIGKPLETLIPPRLRAMSRRDFAAFAAGKEVAKRMGKHGAEIVGLRKNGEEFPADASISKLEIDSVRIFTVSLRDMTLQKRLEQRLRREVQAREDLLGVVAHDLRSPLTAILLEAELLEPIAGAPGREALTSIEQAVARMDRLIQDLLEVARIEREGLPIAASPLPADRVGAAAAAAHASSLRSA
jgi:PAS domain S-box-containing protein